MRQKKGRNCQNIQVFQPIPVQGSEHVIEVDMVIMAMGAGKKAAKAIDAYLKDGVW